MFAMSKAKRQDGWWYPWIFVAAFGVIVAVNGTMAYLALDTWTGLETQNPFQRGQAYNAELAQKAAQAELGWSARAAFERAPKVGAAHGGFIRLTFTDRQGLGVGALAIDATAVRPTHEGYDRKLEFVARAPGVYVAPADLPLPGLWELRITATRAGEVFKMRQRIQVP